jgi:glycosyltransferase involved in cell wall biosynthesis
MLSDKKNNKKQLLIVCPHPRNVAPGQRLKYEQYINNWEENGYNVCIKSFMTMRLWNIVYKKGFIFEKVFWTIYGYIQRISLLFKLKKYDVVYIFLWVTPFGGTLFERIFCKLSKKVIYDIDDLVYHKDHKSEANSFMSILKGRYKPIYLMSKSDHVITCTPHLDSFVRQFNNNTTDISSTINTDTYIPVNKYSNDNTIVIGWSGSHSTSKYIHLIKNVLINISKKYQIKIHIIGDTKFKLEELDNIVVIPWSEETEVSELQKFDIGIYPLPNEEWVLGKSGLKALQYMALGIPTVAAAIGANFRVIENGVSGILVENNKDWEKALISYIEDPNLRKAHGLAARKRVEEYYSVKANKIKYLEILDKLSK